MKTYKGSVTKVGKTKQKLESEAFPFPEQAREWIGRQGKVRSATILEAESEGINAGKYFLHLIVK